jgi:hypothetical protein
MNFMKSLKALQVRPNPKAPPNVPEKDKKEKDSKKALILKYLGEHYEATTKDIASFLGIKLVTCYAYICELKVAGRIATRAGYGPRGKKYHRLINKENTNEEA